MPESGATGRRYGGAVTTSQRRHVPLRSTCAEPHSCPAPVRLRVLRQVPIFADLSEADLVGLDRRMTSLAWSEGEHLYDAGEAAEHLYVIAAGQAKVYRSTPEGQEVVVDLVGPGDLVGGLRTLGTPTYAETVETLTTVCALRIGAATFGAVLEEFPAVTLRVLQDVATQLGRARATVTEQASGSVAERVAATLLRLADKFGQPGPGGVLIQVPLSRADLAGLTGSTPESVSRTMSRLRRDGVVESGRRWTAVRDRARLEALAGQSAAD